MRIAVIVGVLASLLASAVSADGGGAAAPSPLDNDLERRSHNDRSESPAGLFHFRLDRSCSIGETPTGDKAWLPNCAAPAKDLMRRRISEVRESAEAGSAYDQFVLGFVHWMGRRAPYDPVRALMWFSLAADNGHKGAQRAKRALAREMSPAQIATAERMVRTWLARHRQARPTGTVAP